MAEEPQEFQDRALWKRLEKELGAKTPSSCPDPLLLAAYAEARLPEPEVTALEDHFCRCTDCLETVRVARGDLAIILPVSDEVLRRAKGLHSEATPFRDRSKSAVPLPIRRGFLSRMGLRGVALAAGVIICITGFHLGAQCATGGWEATRLLDASAFGSWEAWFDYSGVDLPAHEVEEKP